MKASSPVFAAVQKPDLILGLPVKAFVCRAVAWLALFAASVAAGWAILGFPAMVLGLLWSGVRLWRAAHADCHYDAMVFVAPRWWMRRRVARSDPDVRVLIAGGPS